MGVPLRVEGVHNIRDLGGYPLAEGGVTREQVLIRASGLDQVPASAQQQLIDYGVKTVIDLRDEWEVEHYPNVFARSTAVEYVNLPMIGSKLSNSDVWKAELQSCQHLHEMYARFLDRCQKQIGAIVSAIAESPAVTIFHCYAGKDRTGIITALVLGTVGVSEQLIVEDYAASSAQLAVLKAMWRANALQVGSDLEILERDIASETGTMVETLAHLRQQYGGISDYLRRCGVSDDHLAQLRNRLVQVEPPH